MKRITKQDLPTILTEEVIEILVEMALEFPQTKEWHEIFNELDRRGQLIMVLDRVQERQKAIEQEKENTKTEEKKQAEEEQRKKFYENLNPYGFYGNMGQPQTVQDYKDRYGVWPPGYDERIIPGKLPDVLSKKQVKIIANIYIKYQAPQYWAEISSELKYKKKGQLMRVFKKVHELTGNNFPMYGNPLRAITPEEFKDRYDVWPPGYDKNEEKSTKDT